jgi:broad specificity phosphatase PhoE
VSRRRIYLMRHAAVSYFDGGRPLHPDSVPLTAEGREQARAAAVALADVRFDRVLTSGLPRTLETAGLVAPGVDSESWPELRELVGGRLADIPEDELERAFVRFFEDVVPEDLRFLGGETIGSLFDRVLPALERLLADDGWDVALAVLHGGVNRAILSYALTGGRTFLGNFEQAPACLNVLDVVRGAEPRGRSGWIVRAVNVTPYDLAHLRGRLTTMEELWTEYRSTSSTTPSSS